MKFYFDVTEIFTKSFAVEADDISEATAKIQQAYEEGKIAVPHNLPDDYKIVDVTDELNDILGSDLAEEEVEVVRDLAEESVDRDFYAMYDNFDRCLNDFLDVVETLMPPEYLSERD